MRKGRKRLRSNDEVLDDLFHPILGNGFLSFGRANDVDDDIASFHELLNVFEASLIRNFDALL